MAPALDLAGGGLDYRSAVSRPIGRSTRAAQTNYLPSPILDKFRTLYAQHVKAFRLSFTDPAGASVYLVFHQGDGRP